MKGYVFLIDTLLCPFNRHFFIKMYFCYIFNMKGYVLSIDTFSYIYIYINMELEFSQRKFQYSNFPLYFLQMNTL